MNEVEKWYDEKYDEWNRLAQHKVEFEITKRYLDQYITKHAKIFDIGGGPGRYSIYLADKGHEVTLLDLSKHNVEVAREKAEEAGVVLKGYIKGDALALDEYEEGAYDVVLLMGPLYHLTKEEDRKKAIANAKRLLKKDGLIVASFISQYAPIQDCLSWLKFEGYEGEVDGLLHYLQDGENKEETGFTTAYFTGIQEAKSLMNEFGFEELAFAGVENILMSKEEEVNKLPEEEFLKWLDLAFALSEDSNLYGTSEHFLYVGRKKE